MNTTGVLSPDAIERYREAGFVVFLLAGTVIFALGIGFLVIGVGIGTSPPAPYMTATDKYALVGLSVAALAVGGALIRGAGKAVGW